MTDELHSLSVKLNQPNHLATLGCFIEGIADVVQEMVVIPQKRRWQGWTTKRLSLQKEPKQEQVMMSPLIIVASDKLKWTGGLQLLPDSQVETIVKQLGLICAGWLDGGGYKTFVKTKHVEKMTLLFVLWII